MSHDGEVIADVVRPSTEADFARGTVMRDYSDPSTRQELSAALFPEDVYLRACRDKPGASEATRRKWRRQLERRSA